MDEFDLGEWIPKTPAGDLKRSWYAQLIQEQRRVLGNCLRVFNGQIRAGESEIERLQAAVDGLKTQRDALAADIARVDKEAQSLEVAREDLVVRVRRRGAGPAPRVFHDVRSSCGWTPKSNYRDLLVTEALNEGLRGCSNCCWRWSTGQDAAG